MIILYVIAAMFVGLIVGLLITGHVSNSAICQAWDAGRETGLAEGRQLMEQMQRRINRLESANKRVLLYGEADQ